MHKPAHTQLYTTIDLAEAEIVYNAVLSRVRSQKVFTVQQLL